MSREVKEAESKVVHRLTPEAYRELESKLPKPIAGPNDQTAFNLGIQHVLAVLRQGFVA
ncbi:hypothetical protein ZPAH7B_orf00018 [Aeromonas phage ZPAH7B]|uniref:Uncharacterized protein n=2 Tax=Aerosvirus ZPAH7 TaxID=2733366 RepID=A0A3Q9GHK0_9CAUD|nr:hypothetical protein HOU89_gp18 [Aeromonas phage ZPAH7]AZQ96399.1 hypothetical protein ZPAH7_orf00018 [Aeromonas phage ZPAH7]QAX95979.1 hypothetical protein ZPAH7B_orf00018 [Aeromonas phage ZPAH7B]